MQQGAAGFAAAWNPTPGQTPLLGCITCCTSWKRRDISLSLMSSALQNCTIVPLVLADFSFKTGQKSNQRCSLPLRSAFSIGKIITSLLYPPSSRAHNLRDLTSKTPNDRSHMGGEHSPKLAPCFTVRNGLQKKTTVAHIGLKHNRF